VGANGCIYSIDLGRIRIKSDSDTHLPIASRTRARLQFSDEGETVMAFNRKDLIKLLNEDLSREYQAIISYVNYSQVLKGATYMQIAKELESHAKEELDHALKIAKQIDYLGGMPSVTPVAVKTSEKAEDMLKFDLENERVTIANYRTRLKQAESLTEYALSETIREILVEEQDHLIDLATALGIDPPDAGEA
jgi:bacterioferritin